MRLSLAGLEATRPSDSPVSCTLMELSYSHALCGSWDQNSHIHNKKQSVLNSWSSLQHQKTDSYITTLKLSLGTPNFSYMKCNLVFIYEFYGLFSRCFCPKSITLNNSIMRLLFFFLGHWIQWVSSIWKYFLSYKMFCCSF